MFASVPHEDAAKITVTGWLPKLPTRAQVVALALDQALAIVVFKAHHDVAAIVGKIVSKDHGERFFFEIPLAFAFTVVGVDFEALKIIL